MKIDIPFSEFFLENMTLTRGTPPCTPHLEVPPPPRVLKQPAENVFRFRYEKIIGLRYMLIEKDPLGQVKFVHLLKVTVLNLHLTLMKPEIQLIISEAGLY